LSQFHKFPSQNAVTENSHKDCSLPKFRWTKYALSLLKTCQMTSGNANQTEYILKT